MSFFGEVEYYVEALSYNDLADRVAIVRDNVVIALCRVPRPDVYSARMKMTKRKISEAILYEDGTLNLHEEGLEDRVGYVLAEAKPIPKDFTVWLTNSPRTGFQIACQSPIHLVDAKDRNNILSEPVPITRVKEPYYDHIA